MRQHTENTLDLKSLDPTRELTRRESQNRLKVPASGLIGKHEASSKGQLVLAYLLLLILTLMILQGVSFIPINESAANADNDTLSDEGTPSSIPTRLAPVPASNQHRTSKQSKPQATKPLKQPQPKMKETSEKEIIPIKPEASWAIDAANIITQPSQSYKHSIENDGSESSSSKRRRLFRRQGQAQPIYSGKWHQMDDVMNPKQSLKVKFKAYSPQKSHADEDEDGDSDELGKLQGHESDPDANGEDEAEGSDDEVVHSIHRLPNPDRRRSSRTLLQGDVPNYDMRYGFLLYSSQFAAYANYFSRFHPAYDKACRPAAAKAATLRRAKTQKPRSASMDTTSTLVEGGSATPSHDVTTREKLCTTLSAPAPKLSYSKIHCVSIPELPQPSTRSPTPSSPPAWSNLQNPYANAGPLEYEKLEPLDRLIYSLQKGTPGQDNTLPITWREAKRVLFDYGEINLDELNSEEGTEWLKARYESVRLGVQAFFGGKREYSDKNDWTLNHTEGFDVFDEQCGSKYWKHQIHSVESPTTTRATYRETGEVAETDDENDASVGGDQFEVYKDPAASGAVMPAVEAEAAGADEYDKEGNTVIDLEDANSVIEGAEHTLIESMRGKDALSSELILNDEKLGKLLSPIAQFIAEPSPSYPNSPSAQLVPNVLKDDQPHNFNERASCEAVKSPKSTQSTIDPRLLDAFQPIINQYVADVKHIVSDALAPTTTTKKRKLRTKAEGTVNIHEDLPGGTPMIRRITANNPLSPGTDVPKENLCDDGTVEHSSQNDFRTPTIRRQRAATTSPIPLRYVAYSSLFGGPTDPQSPST